MKAFVLDCSLTMTWCFEDETTPYSEAVLDRLADYEAWAPALWPLEVANVLLVCERRKRLTSDHSLRFIRKLRALPIRIDDDTARQALETTIALAREHQLSSYDAAYLELAVRKGLPLASQDRELLKAAKACGIVPLP